MPVDHTGIIFPPIYYVNTVQPVTANFTIRRSWQASVYVMKLVYASSVSYLITLAKIEAYPIKYSVKLPSTFSNTYNLYTMKRQ